MRDIRQLINELKVSFNIPRTHLLNEYSAEIRIRDIEYNFIKCIYIDVLQYQPDIQLSYMDDVGPYNTCTKTVPSSDSLIETIRNILNEKREKIKKVKKINAIKKMLSMSLISDLEDKDLSYETNANGSISLPSGIILSPIKTDDKIVNVTVQYGMSLNEKQYKKFIDFLESLEE